MERPRIVATVTKSMKQKQWIDIHADGWYIGSLWGTATALHTDSFLSLNGQYRLDVNDSGSYLWVDEIKRRVEAVEPIKPIETELVKL